MKRQMVSLILTFGMLASLITAAPDAPTVQTQIAAMSVGTNIELRLKNKEKLRGAKRKRFGQRLHAGQSEVGGSRGCVQ